jgi:hypothetical protein
MSLDKKPTWSYAATCRECGNMYAVIVDAPELRQRIARCLAEWAKEGAIIEHVLSDTVREQFAPCTCGNPSAEQPQLPLPEE